MVLAGCAASRPGLPPGARVLARGSLAYAVAVTTDTVVTVELEERFALVVRALTTGRERQRVDLGPPERDLPALAVGGGRAWVGGDDQRVREIDLANGGVVATWPVGADVTALAWLPEGAGGWLAVGDATGVVCLRRLPDGALVQCLAGAAPVARLDAGPGGLWVADAAGSRGFSVPTLAETEGAAPAMRWRGQALAAAGHEVRAGDRVLLRLPGRVQAIAVGPGGELGVAAWVARLGDPAVIVLAPPAPAPGRP